MVRFYWLRVSCLEISLMWKRQDFMINSKEPGPCLNLKTVFPRYVDSHIKDIFNMGMPIPVRRHLYIETASLWTSAEWTLTYIKTTRHIDKCSQKQTYMTSIIRNLPSNNQIITIGALFQNKNIRICKYVAIIPLLSKPAELFPCKLLSISKYT